MGERIPWRRGASGPSWSVKHCAALPLTLGAAAGLVAGCAALTGLDDYELEGPQPTTSAASGPGGAGGAGAGGAATSCWDTDVSAFVEDTSFDGALLAGQDPHELFVTPDGLSLYYLATDINGSVALFKVTRADRSANFSGGVPEPVTGWPATPAVQYAVLSFDGRELVVSRQSALYISLWNNDSWGPFSALVMNEPQENLSETVLSLTNDGERLIFQRNDGPIIDVNGPLTLERFHEAVRTSPVPGGAFGPPALVEIPTLTAGTPAYPHGLYCPAISADGTRLFFASNREEITLRTLPSALKIAMAQRASRTAPWGEPVWLPDALNSSVQESCPDAITEDGCELYYHHFGSMTGYTTHVARRSPP